MTADIMAGEGSGTTHLEAELQLYILDQDPILDVRAHHCLMANPLSLFPLPYQSITV